MAAAILVLASFFLFLVLNESSPKSNNINISQASPSINPAKILPTPKPTAQNTPKKKEKIIEKPIIEKTKGRTISLLAFGDIMLARNVEAKINKYGKDYPFEKILPLINEKKRDFVFANIEGPIMEKYVKINTGSTTFSFPSTTPSTLKKNGITIVSIANNHMLDHGQNGLDETREYLSGAGIYFFGSPTVVSEERVFVKIIGERNFVFIGLNSAVTGLDEKKAIELIQNYEKDKTNFIIVSIHWGEEYKLVSNTAQNKFAHTMIDSGVDLVLGQHPHVVQEIEQYKNRMIFYSMGNFVFDQYFSEETQEGLGADIEIGDAEIVFNLIPIQSVESQPQTMEGEKAKKWLKALADRSSKTLNEMIQNRKITATFDNSLP